MFQWTGESIEWYARAAEQSRYFDSVARELSPFIASGDTIGEIGCGPGYLSLALSPLADSIAAVDIDTGVLAFLGARMTQRRISNIRPVNQDWQTLSALGWDHVIISNFGELPDDIPALLKLCKKQLIIIRRLCHNREKRKNFFHTLSYLENNGYQFQYFSRRLEFGQPFYSQEEAAAYFGHYGQSETNIQAALAKLIPCVNYPLYYPINTFTVFLIVASPEGIGDQYAHFS